MIRPAGEIPMWDNVMIGYDVFFRVESDSEGLAQFYCSRKNAHCYLAEDADVEHVQEVEIDAY